MWQKFGQGPPPPLIWTKSKRTATFFRETFPKVVWGSVRRQGAAERRSPEGFFPHREFHTRPRGPFFLGGTLSASTWIRLEHILSDNKIPNYHSLTNNLIAMKPENSQPLLKLPHAESYDMIWWGTNSGITKRKKIRWICVHSAHAWDRQHKVWYRDGN